MDTDKLDKKVFFLTTKQDYAQFRQVAAKKRRTVGSLLREWSEIGLRKAMKEKKKRYGKVKQPNRKKKIQKRNKSR